ncbi:MAG: archease [Pseudomonadota bacterium]
MYHFLDDVAIADAAYEVHAESLPALFREAGEALMKVQVENLGDIRRARMVKIVLADERLDMLLYQFLQELVYYKDAQRLLLLVEAVEIEKGADEVWRLTAEAAGEEIDSEKHILAADVKAVTMHRFDVSHGPDGTWRATVVVDV